MLMSSTTRSRRKTNNSREKLIMHFNVRRILDPRILAVAALGVVVTASAAGFAAANTVPNTVAGDGSGTISGLTISAIHYGLTTGDPKTLDNVTFTTSAAPAVGSTITIKLVAAGTTWYTCTNVTTAVTCDTSATPPTVASLDSLDIVVAA
jgi:hypothetical protein